jgi:hypothetical protein
MLEFFPADRIPEFTAQTLILGFEGPHILELIRLHQPTRNDIGLEVFDQALRAPLGRVQAKLWVAREIVLRILRNQASPVRGAVESQMLAHRKRDVETSRVLFERGRVLHSMGDMTPASREREWAIFEWSWDW